MKRVAKIRTPNSIQSNLSKPSGKTPRREQKPRHADASKSSLNAAPKASSGVSDASAASDSTAASEAFEAYEDMVVHYVDDVKSPESEVHRVPRDGLFSGRAKINGSHSDRFHDLEKDHNEGSNDELDSETNKDSASSQGDPFTAEDETVDKASQISSGKSTPDRSRQSKNKSDRESGRLQPKKSNSTLERSAKQGTSKGISNSSSYKCSQKTEAHRSLQTEVNVDKPIEEEKEIDVWEDALASAQSLGSDNEMVEEKSTRQEVEMINKRIETLQARVGKLEEELRGVAALELSIYSVVPEHGGATSKLHTPARRLFRLYVHSCKHQAQTEQAMTPKNIVSGLLFAAKSCINDASRLTFWLSNTIMLREMVSQRPSRWCNAKESTMSEDTGVCSGKHANGCMEPSENWKEAGEFLAALKEVESWIFMRIVEFIWSQVLTPLMQSPVSPRAAGRTTEPLLRRALSNQQKGIASIDLWNNAFHKAFQQLCPIRAGRRECGCLPVLARMVMEICIARLDVAMFNAILRESAHQVPTDPVSDPISDPNVLPIPSGDLSFASGAQLKNAVGNWSRLLTDIYGIDADDSHMIDQNNDENQWRDGDAGFKPFRLLNELSDLLMLPKDMLIDRSIKKEVCPSISLALITRILCNFTPDEFCPDPVPGFVLEELNTQSINERRVSGESARSFPCLADNISYRPPSCEDFLEEIIDIGGKFPFSMQTTGYMSDEEFQQPVPAFTPMVKNGSSTPNITTNGGGRRLDHIKYGEVIKRFELLQEARIAE